MARLSDPVTILKGVGPTKAKQFAALNIYTLRDLICHFPRYYEDRTKLVTIDKLEADKPACFRAMVMNTPRTAHIRKGLDLTRVQVADHTARLNLTFFNQKFTTDKLEYGKEYIFYGAISGDYGHYGMTSPAFEEIDSTPITTRRVLPRYPLTAGLSNAAMVKAVQQALAICQPPEEILPESIRAEYDILPAHRAYFAIHDPASMEEAELAKRRLIFEEFFVFSAGLSLVRARRETVATQPYENLDLTPLYNSLPFALTGAQMRTIGEIGADLQKGKPMNRLVQGDVGSGKTMVAVAAAYLAVKNHRQAAMMAPTEILAQQHYASVSKVLTPLGIRVGLLTGSMTPSQKKQVRLQAEQGQIDFLIGTHALVSESTVFENLDLVITDEQHRFGVDQRAKLSGKGKHPHLLVMSATPIPRTLALILYGDLEVSVLDELPPGRQTVESFLVDESYRKRINAFIRKQVQEQHQCFVVCPAVEENGELDLKAATVCASWVTSLS